MIYTNLSSLLESRFAIRMKHLYEEQAGAYHKLRDKDTIGGRRYNITSQERNVCDKEMEIVAFVINASKKLTLLPVVSSESRQEAFLSGALCRIFDLGSTRYIWPK